MGGGSDAEGTPGYAVSLLVNEMKAANEMRRGDKIWPHGAQIMVFNSCVVCEFVLTIFLCLYVVIKYLMTRGS